MKTKADGPSFASQVREELVRQPLGKSCCQLSEIDALTQTSGHLAFRGRGVITVYYRLENTGAARRLFQLLKIRLNVNPMLHYTTTKQLGGHRTWFLMLDEKDSRILLAALHMIETGEDGTLSLKRNVSRHPMTRQCCRKAFLRGAFLGAGTMSNPEKGYHFEWKAENERLAVNLRRLMEKSGFPYQTYLRRNMQVIYIKEADQIISLLALMGASGSLLKMENIRVNKQTRLHATRAANCDEHNSERMLDAAQKQAEACRKISLQLGLFNLPPGLRELARKRMENPELSLTELGEAMEPPLGKSAVNHRLRRLMQIASELDQQQSGVH